MYFDNSALRVSINADFEFLQLVLRGMLSDQQTRDVMNRHASKCGADFRVADNRLHVQRVQEICQLQHVQSNRKSTNNATFTAEGVSAAERAILLNRQDDKRNTYVAISLSYKVSSLPSEDPDLGIVTVFRMGIIAKYIMQTIRLAAKLSDDQRDIAEIPATPCDTIVHTIFDQYARYQLEPHARCAELCATVSEVFVRYPKLKIRSEEHYQSIRLMLIDFTARLLFVRSPMDLDLAFSRVSLFIAWHDRCMTSCFKSCTMRLDETLELPHNWLDTFDCFIFSKVTTAIIECRCNAAFPFFSQSHADTGFIRKMFLDHVTKHALSSSIEGQMQPVKSIVPASLGESAWLEQAIKKAIASILVPTESSSDRKKLASADEEKKAKKKKETASKRQIDQNNAAIPSMPKEGCPKLLVASISSDIIAIIGLAEQVRRSVHGIIARVRAMRCPFDHVLFMSCARL